MKRIPSIVPALQEHVPLIVANMRQADIEEMALLGLTPTDAVTYSLKTSRLAYTGFINYEAVCLFGVCPSSLLTPQTGRPWFMSTASIENNQILFLRRCLPTVEQMLGFFPRLENWVSVENKKAISWLKWLKFAFDEPANYGPNNKMFMRFYKERV